MSKFVDSIAYVTPPDMTPDIRDLANALPLNAASLEMLLGVAERFADRLHIDGGVNGADDVRDMICDAIQGAESIAPITPEDRTEWAADDAADRRGDERRLERMA